MKHITVQEVRNALIACDFLSEEESAELTDEELLGQNFQSDLELDSLDFLLLVEKLEQDDQLTTPDIKAWDCHTVEELIQLSNN